jgi:uncharacterized membrane protein YkoI
MTDKLKGAVIALAAVVALGAGGAAAAGAVGGDDEQGRDDSGTEQAITGTALKSASAAAVGAVGGDGKVTGTEVGDEEGYYEVEVTKPDGTQVDVHLNSDFSLAGTEGDGSGDDS